MQKIVLVIIRFHLNLCNQIKCLISFLSTMRHIISQNGQPNFMKEIRTRQNSPESPMKLWKPIGKWLAHIIEYFASWMLSKVSEDRLNDCSSIRFERFYAPFICNGLKNRQIPFRGYVNHKCTTVEIWYNFIWIKKCFFPSFTARYAVLFLMDAVQLSCKIKKKTEIRCQFDVI